MTGTRSSAPIALWAPVAVCMAAIFAASSQPTLPSAVELVWDKLLHGCAYAVLGALVVRALSGRWRRPISIRMVATAVIVAALYGASDEIHQRFVPPRQMDVRDLIADIAGAAVAAAALFACSAYVRGRRELRTRPAEARRRRELRTGPAEARRSRELRTRPAEARRRRAKADIISSRNGL